LAARWEGAAAPKSCRKVGFADRKWFANQLYAGLLAADIFNDTGVGPAAIDERFSIV
jgi:hypothetical protein